MSKLKTPREKKLASLALDNRNVYWGNHKAGRKRIPRAKQESQQLLRRSAKQQLHNVGGQISEDDLVAAESRVRSKEIQGKRKAFKKRPDEPLSAILEYKKTGNMRAVTGRLK